MRITLHIGSHKAGSTAIQNTCSNETALLEAAGVFYPEGIFAKFPKQHSELAALIEHGDEDELQAIITRIVEEANARKLSHVFLSGEDLCSAASPKGIDRLAVALRSHFEEVAIVLVLRRKYDYLLSHLNHYLRHHSHPITFTEFRNFLGFSPRLTIARWAHAFGANSVKAFAYDSPTDGLTFLERFFGETLDITLTNNALKASASVNASFDLLSAIVVNEAVKTIPEFDISDVNLAYLSAFQSHKGKMPLLETDIATYLNELFPDEDWVVNGLPDLTLLPKPAQPLTEENARNYLHCIANFFITLRGLYCPDDPDVPLGRSDIALAYRVFLGRAPNRDELERMTRSRKSMPALRQMIVDSPEFRRVHREKLNMASLDLPALDVCVQATETQQQAMFVHLKERWNKLGKERSHWSVWSEPEFSGAVTPQLEDEFYRTGAKELNALKQTLARAGRSFTSIRRMVDFGCGLGRFTLNAAQEIPEVVGIDFSYSHLRGAEAAAKSRNIDNITWIQKQGLEPLEVGFYDAWYSRIVLQHNPPALIERWLREGLGSLSDGGIAVFQVPTYSVNYSFSPEKYLLSLDDQPEIEMHCLPQGAVLRIIDEMSCRLLELREDNAVDIPRYWVSNTFVVERYTREV